MVVTKPSSSITEVKFETNKNTILLLSDVHFDSCSCDRKLLKEVLNEAKEKNAAIIFNGDFFDMMQGRNDKRGGKGHLRKEYLGDNYVDLVIEDAYEFLKPYVENIILMADGNHETAILKYLETNPLDRLCGMLKKKNGSKVVHCGYQGWVILRMPRGLNDKHNKYHSFKIKMHHGSGGNARVTKGVIEHNRISTYVEGADMVWLAHTHTQYCMHSTIEKMHESYPYRISLKKTFQVRTGCWKQEFKEGGWSVEKGFSPSEIGGYWLELSMKYFDKKIELISKVYPT